jgi:hypothetical protein
MKKAEIITAINTLITEHDLDFDIVAEDSKAKVGDLKDLLADVEDAAREVAAPPVVRIADLCREAGKDPKTVRNRLRRLYSGDNAADLPQPLADAGQRWTFREEDREAVEALIINE